ncbi:MAG: hypothetical protein ACJAWH_001640 [Maribacter sp.]|jgi:hypothetical protein
MDSSIIASILLLGSLLQETVGREEGIIPRRALLKSRFRGDDFCWEHINDRWEDERLKMVGKETL